MFTTRDAGAKKGDTEIMKLRSSTGRKLKYGGVSAALTALIIAVIIIVNVIFSALTQKFMWYVDLTPELLYSLSDEALTLIEKGDDKFDTLSPIEMVDSIREEKKAENADFDDRSLMINIYFCDDPDNINSNSTQRYVHHTALELADKFPDHINVEYLDVVRNPSSVDKFRVNSLTPINTTSVIIEFGTEYRVRTLKSFYTYNSSEDTEPWAYNGEKAFASSILAVTRAEAPIACITTNHGETMSEQFLQTIVDAGYEIKTLDLSAQQIPEKCRLIVVHNPLSDFDTAGSDNEITKLDKFLDGTNSLMVFMNPDSAPLPEFEEYLTEWGIAFDRTGDAAHRVMDSSQALTPDGYTFKGEYVTVGGAASLTEDLRSRGVPQSMIFKNAMSISYTYENAHYTPEDSSSGKAEYDYGSYYVDGTSRTIHDLFVTSSKAQAFSNGQLINSATEEKPLKLMTMSIESRTTQESNYTTVNEASYVIACGSTDFTSGELLQSSAYGNTDFLLTALRAIGREPVPVGLMPKPFADYDIDTVTTAEATQYTLVLALVPLFAASITGVVIIIRRKNR